MTTYQTFTKEEQDRFTISYDEAQERLRDIVDEFGVVIVTQIIDPASSTAFEESFVADWIDVVDRCHLSPRQLEVVESFRKSGTVREAPDCLTSALINKKGRLAGRGMSHGRFAWGARLHPRVRQIFSILFEDAPIESLATGLDNPFFAPADAPKQSENHEWLHVDQNTNTGLLWQCYQGLLYVWGSDETASTTVLWPKSHRSEVYDQIMADEYSKQRGKKSWGQLVGLNKLEGKDGAMIHRRALDGARRVSMPPGSLLLWDSKLTHQGWQSGPRLAMPVCWEPRDRRDGGGLKRKLWLCAAGLPSSHSSSEGRVHGMVAFAKAPRPLKGSEEILPLRPMLVPWCVEPGLEEEWEKLQTSLWEKGKNAKANADLVGMDRGHIEKILRQEVLDSI